jgi:hypothetical protein
MKDVMTIQEVADEYFGGTVTWWGVYTLCKKKDLAHFYAGRRILIRREILDKWVQEQEAKSIKKEPVQEKRIGVLRRIE